MNNLINKIISATWYADICKNHSDYIFAAKHLHPDRVRSDKAAMALSHLNSLRADFKRGYEFYDESGEFRSNYLTHRWSGNNSLLRISKFNYEKIISAAKSNFDMKSFSHFMQYMPSNYNLNQSGIVYESDCKCIPLSKVIALLPCEEKSKHVNWIYSRLIEYVVMLEALNITHAGLNLDSIFIVPEIHGIKITSFYHVCTDNVKTISRKYKNYYPASMFDTKKAGSYIDLNLIKKTAVCSLGDSSGSGVKLRNTGNINRNVLNYLMLPETDAYSSMQIWREILNNNFVKEFIQLNV